MTISTEARTEILRRIAEGESVLAISRSDHLPARSAIYAAIAADLELRRDYEAALVSRFEFHADEILEIADDARNDFMERTAGDSTSWIENGEALRRSQLRVDARKWLLARMLPKKYGDRITSEISGPNAGPIEMDVITDLDAARKIAFALSKGRKLMTTETKSVDKT
jgi:hypothetical protein